MMVENVECTSLWGALSSSARMQHMQCRKLGMFILLVGASLYDELMRTFPLENLQEKLDGRLDLVGSCFC